MTCRIVVRRGRLISKDERTSEKTRDAAQKKGWITPHWEIGCLIRDNFTDDHIEQMGLVEIVIMHEPIRAHVSVPVLLASSRKHHTNWITRYYCELEAKWFDYGGLAFVESIAPRQ